MKYFFAVLLFASQFAFAQDAAKADRETRKGLRTTINYLADDKLEGRRTGTPGEKLAYEYISAEFRKAGLQPLGDTKSYLQPFDFKDGKEPGKENALILNGKKLMLNIDYFPLPYSASTKEISFSTEEVAFFDIGAAEAENSGNPHFDLSEAIAAAAKNAIGSQKKILFLQSQAERKEAFVFNGNDKTPAFAIPVIFLMQAQTETALQSSPPSAATAITSAALGSGEKNDIATISIQEKMRTGHNVTAYIDNHAAGTIILGAHYDHLGYGEDHNSLYAGTTQMVHNGADDNASGVAALIELAKWLKASSFKKYNFLFVAFSGEELGLFGSKYFTEHTSLDLKTVNYMINMDMIGRMNDSTHSLTIGGFGTSPAWGSLINKDEKLFKLNIDSSGSGPSDHTSFYRKDIPVLFFFTGSHKDYHKPTDDAEKINYDGEMRVIRYIQNIILQTDKMDKLVFTKTREATTGKNTFKVSLGIMPDYTYSESGVRVDGVSENRPAQKAGIQTGDVLIQLGEHKFTDVQTYMDALNKFNKGESTNVKVKRGKEELTFPITF